MHDELRAEIEALILTTPLPQIELLAQCVAALDANGDPYADIQVLQAFPNPTLRAKVAQLLATWRRTAPGISGDSFGFALQTAGQVSVLQREAEQIDLVWTGPAGHGPPLRRTDQALLEVIDSAQKSLLVVSFAVYNIPHIQSALLRAASRNVNIQICVESPDESRGKITQSALASLGDQVAHCVTVYIWPYAKRLRSQNDQHGALHVKCAVCDQRLLFVSSANLTKHAFTLNMELGVLIRGGNAPGDVWQQFQRLIEHRELIKIS